MVLRLGSKAEICVYIILTVFKNELTDLFDIVLKNIKLRFVKCVEFLDENTMMFMYHAEFLIDYNLVDSIFSFFGDGFEIFVKTS